MQTKAFFIRDMPPAPIVITGDRYGHTAPAMPRWDQASSRVRQFKLQGSLLDPVSQTGLELACIHARRDPQCEVVVVEFDVWRSWWDLGGYLETLANLSEQKHTVAYIRTAIGTSMLLALFCREIVARPDANIGTIQTFNGEDCSDFDPIVAGKLDAVTVHFLSRLRPQVEDAVWLRLLNTSINGEAAEAMGIVDGLAVSTAALIDRLPRKERS